MDMRVKKSKWKTKHICRTQKKEEEEEEGAFQEDQLLFRTVRSNVQLTVVTGPALGWDRPSLLQTVKS